MMIYENNHLILFIYILDYPFSSLLIKSIRFMSMSLQIHVKAFFIDLI